MRWLLCRLLGVHTWVERRSEYWTLSKGVVGDEVYERCKFCHFPLLGSWRLEVSDAEAE